MAEGAPLLREYANKNRIEGSNPSFSANILLHKSTLKEMRFVPGIFHQV